MLNLSSLELCLYYLCIKVLSSLKVSQMSLVLEIIWSDMSLSHIHTYIHISHNQRQMHQNISIKCANLIDISFVIIDLDLLSLSTLVLKVPSCVVYAASCHGHWRFHLDVMGFANSLIWYLSHLSHTYTHIHTHTQRRMYRNTYKLFWLSSYVHIAAIRMTL